MIGEETAAAWFAAGRFEELADCFRLTAEKGRSPRAAFHYGRALALNGRTGEALTWLRRSVDNRPLEARLIPSREARHPWLAFARAFLKVGDDVGREALQETGRGLGFTPLDWLALARLVQARRTIDDAVAIIRDGIPVEAMPLRLLDVIAEWSLSASAAWDALNDFLRASLPDRQIAFLFAQLRGPCQREDIPAIIRLIQLGEQMPYSKFRVDFTEIGRMLEANTTWRGIPLIGEDLAEVMRVKALRQLAGLIGLSPEDVIDEFPRVVRLIPVSEVARKSYPPPKPA